MEDLPQDPLTPGARTGLVHHVKPPLHILPEPVPVSLLVVVVKSGREVGGGSVEVVEVDEDGEVVGVEASGGLPPGCECQVGATEGQVGGGRGTVGRKTGGGGCVEETEGAVVGGFDYCFPSCYGSVVG